MDIFSKEDGTHIISQKAALSNMNLLFLSFPLSPPPFHIFPVFLSGFDPLSSPLDLFITHLFN